MRWIFLGLLLAGNLCNASAIPSRIVTLMPAIGEITAELLGSAEIKRLVGVSEFSDYPASLKSLPSIGPYHRIHYESILKLKPDLVIASMDGNIRDQVTKLTGFGVKVLVVQSQTLDEISSSFVKIGEAIGKPDAGRKMSERFKESLAAFKTRALQRKKSVSVLLQIGSDPLIVVGGKAFLNQAVEFLGAKNIYGAVQQGYPRVSSEDAVNKNPDQILILSMGQDPNVIIQGWNRFRELNAVKNKRVLVIESSEVVRPTMRFIDGLLKLEQVIFN